MHLQRLWPRQSLCSLICHKQCKPAAHDVKIAALHQPAAHTESQPGTVAAVAAASAAAAPLQLAPQVLYASLAEELRDALRTPPLPRQLGPRVHHLTVQTDGRLSQVVGAALGVDSSYVLELMRFGAVYHCPVMPLPADAAGLPPEQLASINAIRQLGLARFGRSSVHQHPRRTLEDQDVATGAYVRVHLHPKRFPAAYSVAWETRIMHNGPHFVVVDKPAGVQVPPTVDNCIESVEACTSRALGMPPGSLLTTHRLDAGTSGVVVLAKSSPAASWFQRLLADKQECISKVYRCITTAPPPIGVLVHYAVIGQRQQGEPAHTVMHLEATEGSVRCELEVVQVQLVELTGQAAAEWGAMAHEVTIKLITGRTHQIRAQMAAVGCPLMGDLLYTGLLKRGQAASDVDRTQQAWVCSDIQHELNGEEHASLAPSATITRHDGAREAASPGSDRGSVSQVEAASADAVPSPSSSWSRAAQDDPLRPLALQAYRLAMLDTDGRFAVAPTVPSMQETMGEGHLKPSWAVFEAGGPWWRAAPAGHV